MVHSLSLTYHSPDRILYPFSLPLTRCHYVSQSLFRSLKLMWSRLPPSASQAAAPTGICCCACPQVLSMEGCREPQHLFPLRLTFHIWPFCVGFGFLIHESMILWLPMTQPVLFPCHCDSVAFSIFPPIPVFTLNRNKHRLPPNQWKLFFSLLAS